MKKQPESTEIPAAWTIIDTLAETRRIEDCHLILRGYACQRSSDQKVITGSWAGWDEPAIDKARFELQERMALVEAIDQPERMWPILDAQSGAAIGFARGTQLFPVSDQPGRMQFAKSNGVALGENFQDAARRAAYELIERHLILGSWYGGFRPQAADHPLPPPLQSLTTIFDVRHCDFGAFELSNLGRVFVRGTFLWSRDPSVPVVYGFGAGPTETAAQEKALEEAVQRLAFLDPLEAPTAEPEFAPTPDFHQDYFLHPARRGLLENWLLGRDAHPQLSVNVARSGVAHAIDLTPDRPCPGSVVKVMISGTHPLAFGRFQPLGWPALPEAFWIHPIV